MLLAVIVKLSPAGAFVSVIEAKIVVPASACTEYPLIPNDPAAQLESEKSTKLGAVNTGSETALAKEGTWMEEATRAARHSANLRRKLDIFLPVIN